MNLDGIHHITAITGDAPRNVDYYTRVLGLRLTAKTVNQDDPSVYHLFYGDELARPGADITFFEYPGAIPGRAGAGMVHRIVWRVASEQALDFWADRLAAEGIDTERAARSLRFADFEGLGHELVVDASGDAPLIADHPEIPARARAAGLRGRARLQRRAGRDDRALLERLMGARRRDDGAYELRGEQPRRLDRARRAARRARPPERRHRPPRRLGHDRRRAGRVGGPASTTRGMPNSGIIDRHYFHSLYFREPGGVLFELATEEPGFTVDGPVEELGRRIILPPWLEARREQVEARLTPLPDPRADWPVTTK